MSKCFVVNSKELFNKKKNPKLILSVKEILENKKIVKKQFIPTNEISIPIKIQLKPKEIMFLNFPKYKNKKFYFMGWRREYHCEGGFMVKAKIEENRSSKEFSIAYFNDLKINI